MEHGETGDEPWVHPGDAEQAEAAAGEHTGPVAVSEEDHRAMPAPPDTGDARVDDAVRPLADLGDQPSGEHVEAYEQAHTGLQETLTDLDNRVEDDREGG